MRSLSQVALARKLQDEAQAVLARLASRHGMVCSISDLAAVPQDGVVRFRVEMAARTIGGVERARVLFERHCSFVGLEPEDFGKVFPSPLGPCRVVGITEANVKQPIDAVVVESGRAVSFPAKYARRIRRAPAPEAAD